MTHPLKGKICMTLMSAGVRGLNDTDPPCMLNRCALYALCLEGALKSRERIRKLQKKKAFGRQE